MTRTTPDGTTLAWQVAAVAGRPIGDRWPFLIDWGTSPHPSESAPPGGTLVSLSQTDPDPSSLRRVLELMSCDDVEVREANARITARLRTPRGSVDL
jgi:hypothetical protein